jgi:TPP-dependent indolepyruvate ferredoxin oxidoreductase alpha subunit
MTKDKMFDLGRMRLSGSQSLARGAIEAGVRVTAGYPGAPISDLQGSFDQLSGNTPRNNPFTRGLGEVLDKVGYQLVSHWGTTTNEDNAMALALGAVICKGDVKKREYLSKKEWDLVYGDTAFANDKKKQIPVGSRVMCSFKHLGGNTAADVLRVAVNAVPYTGGLSIASGDDRQGTSSQTMQDNKVLFSFHFRIPTLELHSPHTANMIVKNCYCLFEELGVPFALIMNYNLSYREVSVDPMMALDITANQRRREFRRDPKHLVTIGPHIRPKEKKYHSDLIPLFKTKMKEYFEFLGNRVAVYGNEPKAMLVLNGPFREDFQLVNQDPALKERFKSKFGDVLVMKTDIVFPQPDALFNELISKHSIEKIFVFEEGYGRVIYLQLLDMVHRLGLSVKVLDCSIPFEPRIYERFSYMDYIMAVLKEA